MTIKFAQDTCRADELKTDYRFRMGGQMFKITEVVPNDGSEMVTIRFFRSGTEPLDTLGYMTVHRDLVFIYIYEEE